MHLVYRFSKFINIQSVHSSEKQNMETRRDFDQITAFDKNISFFCSVFFS